MELLFIRKSLKYQRLVRCYAALLGVAPNTLRNWDRTGKIQVYRLPVNNYRLYKKADLQRLLASIELTATLPEPSAHVEQESSGV